MKKALYALGVLVCVAAIVLCCVRCDAPADTATTTSTSSVTNSESTTTTEVTATTATDTDGVVLLPTDGITMTDATTTGGTTSKVTTTKKTTTATTRKTTKTTAAGSSTYPTIELHTKVTCFGVEGVFCLDLSHDIYDLLRYHNIGDGHNTHLYFSGYIDADSQNPVFFACAEEVSDHTPSKEVKVHTKLVPTQSTAAPTTTTRPFENGFPDVDVEIHEFETYMLELINAGRVKAGLKPLKMNTYYHDCAEVRAKEASQEFSHTRPNGKSWYTIFEEQGKQLHGHNAGENLGSSFPRSQEGVESIYEALYDSPNHRESMMNPQFTEVAIAIYWEEKPDFPTGYVGTVAQLFFGKIDDDAE